MLQDENEEIPFSDLVKLAEEDGNVQAMRITAPSLFESGNNEDVVKSIKFYEILASEYEVCEAMMFLSWYYQKDTEKSLGWLRKAANLNYTPATVRMAHSYQSKFPLTESTTDNAINSIISDEDSEALVHYSLLAAKNNDSKSCFYMGQLYENGFIVSKSLTKALEFYLLGSDSTCILHASNILMNEKGDTSRAIQLIISSARKFGIPSLKPVADMVLETDPQEALLLYSESSNLGDALSTKILGDFYYFGLGAASNIDISLEFYEKAISLGSKEAVLPCIRIYLEKKEKSKAVELLETFYKDCNIEESLESILNF